MTAVRVAASAQVIEGKVHVVKHEGVSIGLTRLDGTVRAFENKCPHLGLALDRGKIEGGAIHCPWHGSTFDICSGRNLDWVNSVAGLPMPAWSHKLIAFGKAPAPIKTYPVIEQDGHISLSLAP